MLHGTLRQAAAGLRVLLAMTVITGVCYPLAVWVVGWAAFPHQASGSPVTHGGRTVGSSLLGQHFSGPRWFHPRPSAAGADGYDPLASGGSDLGPESRPLLREVDQRRTAAPPAPGRVPPDALTASGSGLDPHISPAYARRQVERVARARALAVPRVRALVEEHARGRILGFLGEPRVNVLELNLALDELARARRGR